MGLKCSVLGHKYGDADVEREREENGSEVVITIQEIETCRRCGTDRVVSENKEVKSIATPDDRGMDRFGSDTVGSDATGTDAVGTDAAPTDEEDEDRTGEDDVARTDDEAAGPDDEGAGPEGTPSDGPVTGSESAAESVSAPVEDVTASDGPDDAEILDAEDDEPVGGTLAGDEGVAGDEGMAGDGPRDGQGHGTAEPAAVDDELVDPSIGGADDGPVADPEDDDAVILGEDDDVRAPGEWPDGFQREDDSDADGSGWSAGTDEDDAPVIKAPDQGTDANEAITVPEGDFRCPECGYTTPVESSSLRAGDFCPECRSGTLLHER